MSRWGNQLAVLRVDLYGFTLKDRFGDIKSYRTDEYPKDPGHVHNWMMAAVTDSGKTCRELREKYNSLPVDQYCVVIYGGPDVDKEVWSSGYITRTEEQATNSAYPMLLKYHPTIDPNDYEEVPQDRDFPVCFRTKDGKDYGYVVHRLYVPGMPEDGSS